MAWQWAGGQPGRLPSKAAGLYGLLLCASWGMACGESDLKCQGQKGQQGPCRCITKDAFSRRAREPGQRDGPDAPLAHLSLPLNSQYDHLSQAMRSFRHSTPSPCLAYPHQDLGGLT